MSPFDLTGGPFLILYGVLLVLTIIAGLLIARWLRPEGGSPHGLGTDQLAFLAGGRDRLGETVVTRMLASGSISLVGSGFEINARGGGSSDAERAILALPSPASWGKLNRAIREHGWSIERRLKDSGLLLEGGTALHLRFWQTLPYFLLIGFGLIKYEVGIARGRPVGFLTILLIVTAIFALIRFFSVDRRTRAAIEALADARARSERLERAPASGEMDMAVALFGTAVLVGSGWAAFHHLRTTASGGDSGSSSSSSDSGGSSDSGSSGCGGGGCGGCGS